MYTIDVQHLQAVMECHHPRSLLQNFSIMELMAPIPPPAAAHPNLDYGFEEQTLVHLIIHWIQVQNASLNLSQGHPGDAQEHLHMNAVSDMDLYKDRKIQTIQHVINMCLIFRLLSDWWICTQTTNPPKLLIPPHWQIEPLPPEKSQNLLSDQQNPLNVKQDILTPTVNLSSSDPVVSGRVLGRERHVIWGQKIKRTYELQFVLLLLCECCWRQHDRL